MNKLKKFEEQKGNRNKMLYKWYKKHIFCDAIKNGIMTMNMANDGQNKF